MLIAKYPNMKINIKNKNGMTMLHEAVKTGSIGIIELLIKAGADVNMQDVIFNYRIEQWEHCSTLCK